MTSEPLATSTSASTSASPPTAPLPSRLPHLAPAGNITPALQPVAHDEPHMPYTCVTCARRKVKCDKTGPPCATCRKARQQCHYQEPAPRKRKRKPVEDLQDRLDRYEALLRDNNILPKDSMPISPTTNVSKGPGESPKEDLSTGKLIKGPGKTRYVMSNIWRNLEEDLHPSSDEEDSGFYRTYQGQLAAEMQRNSSYINSPNSADLVDPLSASFFPPVATMQNLLELHPTYDVAMKLWHQFVQNVDPITKVLHLPTTLGMLQRAAANPSSMSRVNECLLFSIYQFAVASSKDKECQTLFGQSQHALRRRYHDAARQSLVACQFLKTTELAVLQALILFLLGCRDQYDPHTFWIMTGTCVRIAQRIGLHRDGEELGLNPFDIQMRRRVFWQVLPLDGLSGQMSGTGIAIASDSWDTKQPMNVDDEDIWPGMDSSPVERKGATGMIFCLARSEIGKFHQKTRMLLGNWHKSCVEPSTEGVYLALQELENRIEERYIRYCDISNPVHCLTIAMSRGAINSARLRFRLPRNKSEDVSRAERKALVELSIKVIDHLTSLHMNPALERYDWHVKQFFQWDPLIWMLNEVCRSDSVVEPDVPWAKIERLYASRPELLEQKRSLDVALNRLVVRSWNTMQSKSTTPRAEPSFLVELRALLGRKESSSRRTTETPQPRTNVFDPMQDASSDLPVYNYLNNNPLFANNMLDDMHADVDWRFWEQLMQDPQAFGPGLAST